ncbi:phospholipid carrier-dependent glycosyltransferase [Candidatus Microgenomates bacterium]|jgi:4-amino-4-deoxy-L-arabinose transferase-like glycosyltransferase|nr:MAG: phospholipid carrier-dependent glycosyltransferase [Candidatus Microgenomates bacterium]
MLKELQFLHKDYPLILFCFILVVLYFISRFLNLTIIPVFADEAIYVRWAQVMRAVSSLRFLPLSDGKQPLFMWTVIPFLKIINDPLAAGRTVSVFLGMGTMAGVFTLSLSLFRDKKAALLASLFYLITPFVLFFDRMALADAMLSFFMVWSLILFIWLAKSPRLDLAMIAGILTGLGLLTKSPALFLLILLPFSLLAFSFKNKSLLSLIKLVGFWLVIYAFGFAIYNILRLGPEFHMIGIRNKDYVFSLAEIIKHPFNPLVGNLKSALSWYFILMTPPVFFSSILGLLISLKKKFREGLVLFLFFFAPLFGQSLIAKVYTARYILFTVPLLIVFASFFVSLLFQKTKNKVLATFLLTALFIFPLYESLLLIIKPEKAWLPENERSGYLEQWTAGYGIKESANYLKKVAKEEKVLVGTEGYFGTLPDGLLIYLEKVPNITVVGVDFPVRSIPEKLEDGKKDNRVFLMVNDSRFEGPEDNLRLVAKYPKPKNLLTDKAENLLLFEILK